MGCGGVPTWDSGVALARLHVHLYLWKRGRVLWGVVLKERGGSLTLPPPPPPDAPLGVAYHEQEAEARQEQEDAESKHDEVEGL